MMARRTRFRTEAVNRTCIVRVSVVDGSRSISSLSSSFRMALDSVILSILACSTNSAWATAHPVAQTTVARPIWHIGSALWIAHRIPAKVFLITRQSVSRETRAVVSLSVLKGRFFRVFWLVQLAPPSGSPFHWATSSATIFFHKNDKKPSMLMVVRISNTSPCGINS